MMILGSGSRRLCRLGRNDEKYRRTRARRAS
jgi:hypothetical protein